MELDSSRPTGVTAVAWGGIILGTLMAFGGAMGALVSSMISEMPQSGHSAFPAPIAFVFRHFFLFAMLQLIVAAVLVTAGEPCFTFADGEHSSFRVLQRWGSSTCWHSPRSLWRNSFRCSPRPPRSHNPQRWSP